MLITTRGRANESLAPGAEKLELHDWMETLSLVIALAGLVGNSIILWLLGFCIPRNPFSVYILNLAGADALFLCCSFLISIDRFVDYLYYSFTYRVMMYTKYLLYTKYLFYTAGLSLLAAISTEHCLSVLFPIWYRCHHPKHTSVAVCAVLWALAALLWVACFLLCFYIYCSKFFHTFLFIRMVWFTLLTCVLCLSSLTLLLKVQCSSQSQHPPRLYLLVLFTVLSFLPCGLPLEMKYFIAKFVMPYWLPQLLACVNSSVNPFIYFFLGSQRYKSWESLRVVLQRALRDEQKLGGGTRHNPHINSPEISFSEVKDKMLRHGSL